MRLALMQLPQLALLITASTTLVVPARAETTTNPPLCVMTYNLRYASDKAPDAWPERRPLMRELISSVGPDILGTQEGLHAQLLDLAADLPEYQWVGVGRDDGVVKGEFMAVFYRPARLELLGTNYFWLSDTPEVPGSTTWGNSNRRMVTRLKMRDRVTGQEFFLFNTHFDHQIQVAREKSAELVRQRVTALDTKLPVILTGDFNAGAGRNKAYDILTDGRFFIDGWEVAKTRRGEGVGTFNGFKAAQPDGPRIDWILTRGAVTVDRAEIFTFARNGQFPSDHFPVAAWLRLGPAP
jgi:endonuclease/exonuclease/phosphatase family metal-dependent hydrolase